MTFPPAFIINPRRPRSTIQSLKSTKVRSNKLQRRYSHTMPHALAALTRLSGLSIKRGTGESKPARGKEVTDEEVELEVEGLVKEDDEKEDISESLCNACLTTSAHQIPATSNDKEV